MSRAAAFGWLPRLLSAAAVAIVTAACVIPLNPELMTPQPLARVAQRTERTITVPPVTSEGPAKTATLELTDQFLIGDQQFQAAVVNALGASGMFRSVESGGVGDYELQVRIISQQSQRAGFLAATSSLVVNYRLHEAGSDRDVWHETIISEATEEGAPFTEGVPGAARKSLAGAARRNIAEMLQKLAERIR